MNKEMNRLVRAKEKGRKEEREREKKRKRIVDSYICKNIPM